MVIVSDEKISSLASALHKYQFNPTRIGWPLDQLEQLANEIAPDSEDDGEGED